MSCVDPEQVVARFEALDPASLSAEALDAELAALGFAPYKSDAIEAASAINLPSFSCLARIDAPFANALTVEGAAALVLSMPDDVWHAQVGTALHHGVGSDGGLGCLYTKQLTAAFQRGGIPYDDAVSLTDRILDLRRRLAARRLFARRLLLTSAAQHERDIRRLFHFASAADPAIIGLGDRVDAHDEAIVAIRALVADQASIATALADRVDEAGQSIGCLRSAINGVDGRVSIHKGLLDHFVERVSTLTDNMRDLQARVDSLESAHDAHGTRLSNLDYHVALVQQLVSQHRTRSEPAWLSVLQDDVKSSLHELQEQIDALSVSSVASTSATAASTPATSEFGFVKEETPVINFNNAAYGLDKSRLNDWLAEQGNRDAPSSPSMPF